MNKTTTQETFNIKGLPLPRREQFVIVSFYIESELRLMVNLSSKAVPSYWYRPTVSAEKVQSCAILLCESITLGDTL